MRKMLLIISLILMITGSVVNICSMVWLHLYNNPIAIIGVILGVAIITLSGFCVLLSMDVDI